MLWTMSKSKLLLIDDEAGYRSAAEGRVVSRREIMNG